MALQAGSRLGPYEVLSLIGAGGMGEVYQARDTRLDRNVAVKVLAPELATDAEFRARFEREAKAISALNHPHICGLYDIGREHDTEYLVLELLEGETLAARIERGPLPLAQVLRFGIEIADALETAHGHGIVHRDLKPGNIMLTAAGTKLLDFGLAKHTVGTAGQALTMLATAPGTGTAQGTIIGTLQYMAPEQVQGASADARTDIFALGTILYEMATGKRAFEAKTQASLIAKILETDVPAVSTLAPLAPPTLDHVVQSCLAKDPAERWQSAHDILLELRWIQQHGSVPNTTLPLRARRREWLAWAVGAAGVVLVAMSLLHGVKPIISSPSRTEILLPPRLSLHDWADGPVISPDGRTVVFAGVTEGIRRFHVRALDASIVRPVPGTEGGMGPFWSPDGRTVGFSVGDQLRRVALDGGAVVTVGEFTGGFQRFATMNRDGVVLFDGSGETVIRRTNEGGMATAVTRLDASRKEQAHGVPEFLPDGQHFLFVANGPTPAVYIGSLGSTHVERVLDAPGPATADYGYFRLRPRYAAGHLLYVRQRTLMARPFDPSRVEARGSEFPLADGVVSGLFSVSKTGTIAYRPAESDHVSLVWFDRGGSRLGTLGEPAEYRQIVLSPSGGRVAAVRGDPDGADLWMAESAKGVFSRVTQDAGREADPAWSPDERFLAFKKMGSGVFRKDLLTGTETVVSADSNMSIDDWTADGKFLIAKDGSPVIAVPAFGQGSPIRLPQSTEIDETHVSNDGRWVAYNSDESGEWEVYVASFPEFAGKQQVSVAGGLQPNWRRDGRELFFVTPDGEMMSVAISTVPTLRIDTPKRLFTTNLVPTPGWSQYSVTPDGQRFLVMESTRQFFTVLQHWLPAKAGTQ
jgi:eukaryotic-like serine/threonine-protein kinase